MQLAALETSTKCIILTGDLPPNDVIIGKASLKGVPVISVKDDTFKTVEKIEGILGKQKIRGQAKIQKAKELIIRYVDSQKILKKLGIKEKYY
ncbi:MAG: DRTGG domain-containing protein [Candidatus Brocadiaceae bacterium]|nr:DRTGG domain-containing protein [Candidatus Brocadiaceae bacterium]